MEHVLRSRIHRCLRALAGPIAVTAVLLASAGGASARPVSHNASSASGAPHVLTIMMENTDYSQSMGSAAMPYLNQLAHQYAGFTQAYGWTYPSLPNYMELVAGSTVGISSDCDPGDTGCTNLVHQTFTDQLEAAGVSWHAYYQDVVSGCDDNPSDFFHGNYDVEHNPWAYLADFPQQCSHISNFGPLLSDLSSGHAADYNFVVPDLDNDGGDNGTMSSGDTWLSDAIPQIMATPWYRQGGQIVILYDTGYGNSGGVNGSDGGRIPPLLVVSAHTRGMGLQSTPLNTAGVLRSLDAAYGLSYLGDAADPANGSLGHALVAGRPQGPAASPLFAGALAGTGPRGRPTVATVPGSLAFNGITRTTDGSLIQVGENSSGQGVVAANGKRAIPVRGTSNLESVACTSATICWAAGLGPVGSDEAALVKLDRGVPVSVTPEPAFYGLYGIACPTTSTCEAVGYDTSDIADAVTTITNGTAAAPVEVSGGGEWLNGISCPSASECYATGLVNYTASVVPIADGTPGTPITIPDAWYANGIDCTSIGNCVVDGEVGNDGEGMVATLVNGQMGAAQPVPGTENLYGVGCGQDGRCVLAGASQVGTTGYSHGVLLSDDGGQLGPVQAVPTANGLGQVTCGASSTSCVAVGAANRG